MSLPFSWSAPLFSTWFFFFPLLRPTRTTVRVKKYPSDFRDPSGGSRRLPCYRPRSGRRRLGKLYSVEGCWQQWMSGISAPPQIKYQVLSLFSLFPTDIRQSWREKSIAEKAEGPIFLPSVAWIENNMLHLLGFERKTETSCAAVAISVAPLLWAQNESPLFMAYPRPITPCWYIKEKKKRIRK